MPTQGLIPQLGSRPLGRDTDATVRHWGKIVRTMPVAPTIARGPLPRKSPPIWKFINPRTHHQVIGMCVGRSACRMAETLLRIPEGAGPDTAPNPAIDLSSLWTYYNARAESRLRGVRLGSDGAIVSHSIIACSKNGYVPLDMWPDDSDGERAYSDRAGVTPQERAFGRVHELETYAILDTLDKHYAYMSQGFPIQTGMPITEGWLQTAGNGTFRDAGRVIGGHATCTIGYDMDEGWVAILNSWERWGVRSGNPMFGHDDGYTNIGYMPIEEYERHFSPRAIESGGAEAVVANTIEGFAAPKIAWDWTRLYGDSMPS